MSLAIGDIIDDKYRIIRIVGEGGMGTVYEGENTRIHRRVAIKLLRASFADSKDVVQRFEREAQAAGRIGSQHIVEVLDLGQLPNGDHYMVMEFLEGQPLSDRIALSGGVPAPTLAVLAIQLLEGLKAAHAAGIVHRDLKPDNVFLLSDRRGRSDFVKIVDFGISKFSALGNEFSMTRTGAVMGTPYYLSPEQAKGERNVDHRSDLYAVGVIMWEACAGRVPFDGETFNELLFKIVLEPPPPLTDVVTGVNPEFAQIVHKGMAREPDARYQTAAEMQDALVAWYEKHVSATQPMSALPGIGQADPVASILGQRLSSEAIVVPKAKATLPAATHSQTDGNWEHGTNKPTTSSNKMIAAAAILALGAVVFAAITWYGSRHPEHEEAALVPEDEASGPAMGEPPTSAALSQVEPSRGLPEQIPSDPEVRPEALPDGAASSGPNPASTSATSSAPVPGSPKAPASSPVEPTFKAPRAPSQRPTARTEPAPSPLDPSPVNAESPAAPKGRKIRTKL